ncbi:gamma-glutamyltransferase [Desulfopila aestuarii]|uniref:Glutathione hydrolase proenzyme n=1 Tax=Desulfopila aestuarii DSM 18488 TaxID=1121416 RepID=A0A1M7YCK7_9BACT|nr:gamma-glutamyltransferase [Desulfopila aestuarii]SHO50380.1 gamma-glutamyltransferase 1 . Threonine peptidase. MEROPS family T03 [Desulfopila aestuarii DSM 18488]
MCKGLFRLCVKISTVALSTALLFAQTSFSAAIIEGERMSPIPGKDGMVVTSHFLATESALDVLKNGGNAIDAAVTAAFSLAVTQPRSGNIGGGGFMLISSEKKDDVVAIDYREKAPGKATVDMFLNKDGEADSEVSRYSHLASGVPGTVAGLAMALEKYGTINLEQAMAPAIKLAEEGFIVTPRFSEGLKEKEKMLKKWESSTKVFYKPDGTFYEPGELFVQPDLAATLKRIAKNGVKEFYEGKTAELLVAEMTKHGGLITMEDMKNYSPRIKTPVHGTYRGYDIYSMSPPSSGGAHVIQILNILEGYPIGEYGHNSAKTIHLMAEAMKRAYSDRSQYLGDDDFVEVPLKGIISKKYADSLRQKIDTEKATASKTIAPDKPQPYESDETTHFSIVDKFGNAVSNTYTINFSYGSGIVVEGAGFLLNNEMDDFSAKPGVPNAYGLLGGEANKVEPNKRMLSSMSPTIVKHEGKNFLVTGSPGGSRIITTTLQVIMNVIDHGLNIQSAVAAPRIHHQWLPDELRVEEGLSPDSVKLLEEMGHQVQQKSAMGAIQSIMVKDGMMYGGADPRRSTALAAGL